MKRMYGIFVSFRTLTKNGTEHCEFGFWLDLIICYN